MNSEKSKKMKPPYLPNHLNVPSFCLNFPFSLDNKSPNNIWVKEKSKEERTINKERAFGEFMDLYNYLSSYTLTYLLPSGEGMEFQDLVYTANIGAYLPHIKNKNIIVISNFKSKPRRGEEYVGKKFFESIGYETWRPSYFFEGEAELKYITDNVYIGGYGLRSDIRAYSEMAKKFDMEILTLPLTDDYLYHLDTICFPIDNENLLLGVDFVAKKDIKIIEKYVNIIPIDKNDCYNGTTNSVRAGRAVLNATYVDHPSLSDEERQFELGRIERLKKICADIGMELVLFELNEYDKSGAALSCMVMHLNYVDYTK